VASFLGQASVSGGGCARQGHGGWGSPRWSIADEVADGRRHDNIPKRRQCSSGGGSPGELLRSEKATEG
jgi:hypothetical protein